MACHGRRTSPQRSSVSRWRSRCGVSMSSRPAATPGNEKRTMRRSTTAPNSDSELHERLESAPEHAHAVEGHRLGVHIRLHPRVVHHFGVDAVPFLPRVINDPREHDDFVVLELHSLGKRGDFAGLDVVGDTFAELESPILLPDLPAFLRHVPIGVELAFGTGTTNPST